MKGWCCFFLHQIALELSWTISRFNRYCTINMKILTSQNSRQSGLLMGWREVDTTLLLLPSFLLWVFFFLWKWLIHDQCALFVTRLSLSFNSPVALIFTPIPNLLLYGWIVSTTGQFIRNIKGSSNILSCNWCYRLWPLLTALCHTDQLQRLLHGFCKKDCHPKVQWRRCPQEIDENKNECIESIVLNTATEDSRSSMKENVNKNRVWTFWQKWKRAFVWLTLVADWITLYFGHGW